MKINLTLKMLVAIREMADTELAHGSGEQAKRIRDWAAEQLEKRALSKEFEKS